VGTPASVFDLPEDVSKAASSARSRRLLRAAANEEEAGVTQGRLPLLGPFVVVALRDPSGALVGFSQVSRDSRTARMPKSACSESSNPRPRYRDGESRGAWSWFNSQTGEVIRYSRMSCRGRPGVAVCPHSGSFPRSCPLVTSPRRRGRDGLAPQRRQPLPSRSG